MPQFMMDVEQGTDQWRSLRMGKATASNFDRILTEAKGQYAAGADKYAREVAVQRILDEDTEKPLDGLRWIERGKLLEPDAVKHYEKVRGRTTDAIGLIISDDNTRACSPDRISGDRLWGVEIKAPSGPEHLDYMDNGGPGRSYRWQVVGSLLISGFDGWDFVSYHPLLKEVIVAYERSVFTDEIAALDEALKRFEDKVQYYCDLIRREGFIDPRAALPAVPDTEWQQMLKADPGMWAL